MAVEKTGEWTPCLKWVCLGVFNATIVTMPLSKET